MSDGGRWRKPGCRCVWTPSISRGEMDSFVPGEEWCPVHEGKRRPDMREHPVQPYLQRTRFGWWWEVMTYGAARFKPYTCGWNRTAEKARANLARELPRLRAEFDRTESKRNAALAEARRRADAVD